MAHLILINWKLRWFFICSHYDSLLKVRQVTKSRRNRKGDCENRHSHPSASLHKEDGFILKFVSCLKILKSHFSWKNETLNSQEFGLNMQTVSWFGLARRSSQKHNNGPSLDSVFREKPVVYKWQFKCSWATSSQNRREFSQNDASIKHGTVAKFRLKTGDNPEPRISLPNQRNKWTNKMDER